MKPLVVLGIDGLDHGWIRDHLDELPTFRRFAEQGVLAPLPSIFPPDSIPAWITIFTGMPPDQHGVIESIDYLAKNPAASVEDAPNLLRGKTFWDAASARGHRVCVVNPFMAYPAWDVNGAMISGPVFVDAGGPSIRPPEAADGLHLPQLGGIVDFPTPETMADFLERTLEVTREQADFGISLLERTRPDLFFVNVLTIDRVQHFLWRYADPSDPTYAGGELADGVRRAYHATDELIARFVEAAGGGRVVVLSDHGHGQRPARMLYVDELLRRNGLFSTGGVRKSTKTFALERTKRAVLGAAYLLRREHEAYRLAKRVPGKKALKTASYARDDRSVASVSRAFGRNSAGGITISDAITGAERERVALRICALLREVTAPDGSLACEWARPREDLFTGPAAAVYPDVLFQLRRGIGVDFGVFGPLFAPDKMHRRVSGGHLPDGVFAAGDTGLPFVPERLDQIYELVLAALEEV
jgi:hypothetical protein